MWRTESTENLREFAVIAHLRRWCHDSTVCAICKAEDRANKTERELDRIIEG